MKILLISGIYPPDIGGPATFIPKLTNWLYGQGHSVTVLCLADDTTVPPRESWLVVRIARQHLRPIRILVTIMRIRQLARRTDVIFANGLFEEVYLSRIHRRIPVVAKVVGDPVWERAQNSGKTNLSVEEYATARLPLKSALQRRLLLACLSSFSKVVTPSPSLSDLVKSWGGNFDVTVIPNGVPKPATDETPRTKTWDLIAVSRLVPWKRLEVLIAAVRQSNASLLIVGSGPSQSELQALASDTNVQVKFAGQQTLESIPGLMKSARIFAQLSSYEGLSFSLLQAMSLGMPCLVSDIPSHQYALSASGVFVSGDDAEEVGDAIVELLANEEDQRLRGNLAQQRFEAMFDEEQCFQSTLEMMSHVAD